MKTSTKRILSIGLALVFFLATIFVYVTFIQPEMAEISNARSLALSKENLFLSERTAVEQVRGLIEQFKSIDRLQETVSLTLPAAENVTQILHQLQGIARNSQSLIKSFAIKPAAFLPSEELLTKRLGVLDVNLAVEGSYESIKTFVQSLETNVRVANVKSFTVAPISVFGGGQELYNLTLAVEMYYQES